jgi:hypothetical protein
VEGWARANGADGADDAQLSADEQDELWELVKHG